MCCFQRKTPKCKYRILKVLCLETQMVCSGWLRNDSLCLCLHLSSKCYVTSWCNGLGIDIQRPDQEDRYKIESNKCIMHWYESCPGTATLKEFLDQELNENEDDENLFTISGTLRIEQYWQPLQPITKNTERIWSMLLMI